MRRLAARGRARPPASRCVSPPAGRARGGEQDRGEQRAPSSAMRRRRRDGRGRRGLAAPRRVRVALQALQVRLQLGGALVAQVAVLLERRVDDPLELRRQLRVERDGRDRRAVQDRVEDDGRRAAGERLAARRHLVEHGAAGEDVGARRRAPRRAPARATCTRRCRSPCRGSSGASRPSPWAWRCRRSRGRSRLLGEAEVEHLRLAALRDEDVRRLDVAVHDPARVRGLERVGDLRAEIEQRRRASGARARGGRAASRPRAAPWR